MEESRTCPVCGDRMGSYEPVVVIAGQDVRTTSFAREPEVPPGSILVHEQCAGAEDVSALA